MSIGLPGSGLLRQELYVFFSFLTENHSIELAISAIASIFFAIRTKKFGEFALSMWAPFRIWIVEFSGLVRLRIDTHKFV